MNRTIPWTYAVETAIPSLGSWLDRSWRRARTAVMRFAASMLLAERDGDEQERGTDESELVRKAQGGGPRGRAAFRALVRQHEAWVVRMLSFLLGSQADAEDVAQETFLRAYMSLDRFRGESSFKTWVRVIGTRLAYNHRRESSTRARYTDMLDDSPVDRGAADRIEAHQLVGTILEQLPHIYREALVLRHVECLSVQEIAELLQLGESAVKMRLARGREQFEQLHTTVSGDDVRA